MISNHPIMNSTSRSMNNTSNISKRKKRIQNQRDQIQSNPTTVSQWKSDAQQQVYSSKLLQALNQLRINEAAASSSPVPKRGRAVREAADRVLAVTAKGRTRWSRAILTNRLKLKFMKKSSKNKRLQRAIINVTSAGNNNSRWQKKPRVSILRLKGKNLPAVQRKARLLGRLVPGCRKEALPVILEEATDYISALEMQVRAMTALANLLSGGSSSSSRPPPPT